MSQTRKELRQFSGNRREYPSSTRGSTFAEVPTTVFDVFSIIEDLINRKIEESDIVIDAITETKIVDGAITTDKLAANSVTALKLNVAVLSAITADMGTITAGKIDVGSIEINADTERILFGAASAPGTGTGIFLGKDGADYEFRVGDPSLGPYIWWNGTTFVILGDLIATDNLQDAAVTGAKVSLVGSPSGSFTSRVVRTNATETLLFAPASVEIVEETSPSSETSTALSVYPPGLTTSAIVLKVDRTTSGGEIAYLELVTPQSDYRFEALVSGGGSDLLLQRDAATKFWFDRNDRFGAGKSPDTNLHVYEDNTETTPGVLVEQDGTGDAAIQFLLTGGESFSIGIDNSDGDRFKITDNVALGGANQRFAIDSSGYVTGVTNYVSETTIASGAVAMPSHALPGIWLMDLDTESDAASDDLDNVTGAVTGDILMLRAVDNARTVVVKDGTGNFQIAGDFSLQSLADIFTAIWVGTQWLEISRSTNA